MDWQHPGIARLAAVLQGMDDETLAQFANRGLVRRARKDLETDRPKLTVEGDTASVETGGQKVMLGALPADCRCDCPASGLCRHVLAALIFIRENAPAAARVASAREEVLALDAAALEAWAGKSLYESAARTLMSERIEIEDAETVSILLPAWSVRCRWVTGAGLAGMLCSCGGPSPCEHRVVAMLAVLVREGCVSLSLEEPERAGHRAVRSFEDVRASARALLREMVAIGLSRVSGATVERLQTLSVSAHAADLPRLERFLAALASETALHVQRDSQASLSTLLALAANANALVCALANPKPELTGQHRSRYLALGTCEFFGAGARQWRTRSGYVGLTVYFWEPATRRWSTWSAARPAGTPGFSPQRLFDGFGPWDGCLSPRAASASRVRLSGAWRSAAGRISGRPSTTAFTAGATSAGDLPAISNWSDLRQRALALFGGGLGEFDEQQEIVVLRPERWAPASYDEVHQRLWRPIADDRGQAMPLWIPYTAETARAVRVLEAYAPSAGDLVLGLVRIVDGVLCMEPVSVIHPGGVLSLTLAEAVSPDTPLSPIAEAAEDWAADEPAAIAAAPSAAGAILGAALADMEQTAESGLGAATTRHHESAARCEDLFLNIAASSLRHLGAETSRAHRDPSAETRAGAVSALLRAYYVCSLTLRLETLAGALEPLHS